MQSLNNFMCCSLLARPGRLSVSHSVKGSNNFSSDCRRTLFPRPPLKPRSNYSFVCVLENALSFVFSSTPILAWQIVEECVELLPQAHMLPYTRVFLYFFLNLYGQIFAVQRGIATAKVGSFFSLFPLFYSLFLRILRTYWTYLSLWLY